MSVSAVIAPALETATSSRVVGVGFTGAATSPTPTIVVPTTVSTTGHTWADTNSRSYMDVEFRPGADAIIKVSTINGGEFTIGGFGGSGVTPGTGTNNVLHVSGNVWRFLLDGDFKAGPVDITFQAGSFDETTPARGPPVTGTYSNTEFIKSFTVVGTTADLVRTVSANGDVPETVVALGGSTIGRDLINGYGYLEVRFNPTSGNALDPTTITGNEVQLRNSAGILLSFVGSPIREGTSNIWRFTLAAGLVADKYTVTFLAGSFADQSGAVNQTESEDFTVEVPTSVLANPTGGQVIDAGALNGRGYVDVIFALGSNHLSIDSASVLDAGAEFSLKDGAGNDLTLVGTPVFVANSTDSATLGAAIYRYYFSGWKSGTTLAITPILRSWTDTAGGYGKTSSATPAEVDSAFTLSIKASLTSGTWIDVTLDPTDDA
jgi:hypothetical protein